MKWPFRTPAAGERLEHRMDKWKLECQASRAKIYHEAKLIFDMVNIESKSSDDIKQILAQIEVFKAVQLANQEKIYKLSRKTDHKHRKDYEYDGRFDRSHYKGLHETAKGYVKELEDVISGAEGLKKQLLKQLPIYEFGETIKLLDDSYTKILNDAAGLKDDFKAMNDAFDKLTKNTAAHGFEGVDYQMKLAQLKLNLAAFKIDSIEDNITHLEALRINPLDESFGYKTYFLASKLVEADRAQDALSQIKKWSDVASSDDKADHMITMGYLVCSALKNGECADSARFKEMFKTWSSEQKSSWSVEIAADARLEKEKEIDLLEGHLCIATFDYSAETLSLFEKCKALQPGNLEWTHAMILSQIELFDFAKAETLISSLEEKNQPIFSSKLHLKKFMTSLEQFKKAESDDAKHVIYQGLELEFKDLNATWDKLEAGWVPDDLKHALKNEAFLARLEVSTVEENKHELDKVFVTLTTKDHAGWKDSLWSQQLFITSQKIASHDPEAAKDLLGLWWDKAQKHERSIDDLLKIGTIILQMPADVIGGCNHMIVPTFEAFLKDQHEIKAQMLSGATLDEVAKKIAGHIKDSSLMLSNLYLYDERFDKCHLNHYLESEKLSPSPASKLGILNCHLERGDAAAARSYADSIEDKTLVPQMAYTFIKSGYFDEAIGHLEGIDTKTKEPLLAMISVMQYQNATALCDLVSRIAVFAADRLQDKSAPQGTSLRNTALQITSSFFQLLSHPIAQKALFANSFFIHDPLLLSQEFQKAHIEMLDLQGVLSLCSVVSAAVIHPIAQRALIGNEGPKSEDDVKKIIRFNAGFTLAQEGFGAGLTYLRIAKYWDDFVKDRGFQAFELYNGMRSMMSIGCSLYQVSTGYRIERALNPAMRAVYELSHVNQMFNFATQISQLSYQAIIKPNLSSQFLAPVHQFIKYQIIPKVNIPALAFLTGSPYMLKVAADVGFMGVNVLVNFRRRKMEHIMLDTWEKHEMKSHQDAYQFLDSYLNHDYKCDFISFDYKLMKQFKKVLMGVHQVRTLTDFSGFNATWVDDTNAILTEIASKDYMRGAVSILNTSKLVYFIKSNQLDSALALYNYPGVKTEDVKKMVTSAAIIHAFNHYYRQQRDGEDLSVRGRDEKRYLEAVLTRFLEIPHRDIIQAIANLFPKLDTESEAYENQELLNPLMACLDTLIGLTRDKKEFSFIFSWALDWKFKFLYKKKDFAKAEVMLDGYRENQEIYQQLMSHVVTSTVYKIIHSNAVEAFDCHEDEVRTLRVSDSHLLSQFFDKVFAPLLELDIDHFLYHPKKIHTLIGALGNFKTHQNLHRYHKLDGFIESISAKLKELLEMSFIQAADIERSERPAADLIEEFDAASRTLGLFEKPKVRAYRELITDIDTLIMGNFSRLSLDVIKVKLASIDRFLNETLSAEDRVFVSHLVSNRINLNLTASVKALYDHDYLDAFSLIRRANELIPEDHLCKPQIAEASDLLETISLLPRVISNDEDIERFNVVLEFIDQAIANEDLFTQIRIVLNVLRRDFLEKVGDFYLASKNHRDAFRYLSQAYEYTQPEATGYRGQILTKLMLCQRRA